MHDEEFLAGVGKAVIKFDCLSGLLCETIKTLTGIYVAVGGDTSEISKKLDILAGPLAISKVESLSTVIAACILVEVYIEDFSSNVKSSLEKPNDFRKVSEEVESRCSSQIS